MQKKQDQKFKLPSIDDLFSEAEGIYISNNEEVILIPIEEITDFPKHPFKVKDDEEMKDFVESVKQYGVMLPAIVRKKADGGYEMISGHRRKRAVELANMKEIPCIIKNLTDEEATILMVDTNIQQRKEILPSEKAFAYKMKLDAEKHQGKRNDLTSCQLGTKLRTDEIMAENSDDSARQIQRYIRLTELIPEILNLVDEKRIAFNPAVEISYLKQDEQYVLLDCIECNGATPSQAQAIHLKKLSQEDTLTAEKIEEIMGEEKANQKPKYAISYERFEKVLPRNIVTPKEIEDYLYKLAETQYQKDKKRNLSR